MSDPGAVDTVEVHLTRHQADLIQNALGYRLHQVMRLLGADKHDSPREVWEALGGSNGRDDLTDAQRQYRDLYAAVHAFTVQVDREARR